MMLRSLNLSISTLIWQNTNLKVIDDSLEFYQWVLFVYFYDPSWPFSLNISKREASSLYICQTLSTYNAKGSFLPLDKLFLHGSLNFPFMNNLNLWLKHALNLHTNNSQSICFGRKKKQNNVPLVELGLWWIFRIYIYQSWQDITFLMAASEFAIVLK